MDFKWIAVVGMVIGLLGILASIGVTWVSLEARISAMNERENALAERITNLRNRTESRMDENDRFRREILMTIIADINQLKGRACP